jgi:hypothetical protein
MNWPPFHYIMTCFVPALVFDQKSILSEVSMISCSLFLFTFAWNIFFLIVVVGVHCGIYKFLQDIKYIILEFTPPSFSFISPPPQWNNFLSIPLLLVNECSLRGKGICYRQYVVGFWFLWGLFVLFYPFSHSTFWLENFKHLHENLWMPFLLTFSSCFVHPLFLSLVVWRLSRAVCVGSFYLLCICVSICFVVTLRST